MSTKPTAPLLSVRNLVTALDTEDGRILPVDNISFDVPAGQTVGIVGESGCGKSVTALSIMRLLPHPIGKIIGGEVLFQGRNLVSLPEQEMRSLRGSSLSMIFQEPMTALNPVHTVGRQIAEVYRIHTDLSRSEAWERAVEMLKQVGIPHPDKRAHDYPHQLSGGMRQRVVIAIALALNPKLIIADEPTTALDVTIQAQILELLARLREEHGVAVLLITHDLGVIAETCDQVIVMYAGRIVERAPVRQLFAQPQHLYTQGLMASMPQMNSAAKSRLPTIRGQVPSLHNMPAGARFAPRSPSPHAEAYIQTEAYHTERPPLTEVATDHWVEDHPAVRVEAARQP